MQHRFSRFLHGTHDAVPVNDAGGYPVNQFNCTVHCCTQISLNFKRLRLIGDFAAFARPGSGLHFCLLLSPEPGVVPIVGRNGKTVWSGGGVENWHRPPYTVRKLSPQLDWIDIDIFQHQGGRVTEWCNTVRPGDRIAIHGPSGSKRPTARWLGLIGDETALPVIMNILDNDPPDTVGQVYVALKDPDDMQITPNESRVRVERIKRSDPQNMLAAIDRMKPPDTNRHVFFGGDLILARVAKDRFAARGWSRRETYAAGYWSSTK
jgi:NADPH-dependent ferric siderophore reductase